MEKLDQIGLIAYLAKKVGPNNKLGRKAVQKFVHIAASLGKIPTGYRFSFYTYGPYSRELAADLEVAEAIDGIVSCQNPGTTAFDIKAGDAADSIIKNAKNYLENQEKSLNGIFDEFGNFTARTLELYSTILFLRDEEPNIANSLDDLKKRVNQLKPQYSDAEFNQAYQHLKRIEHRFH
ncbi:MAG: hypothetical protein Q8L53_02485 [Aestuariivirga sp.]|nr:hypothetical protein [Aestuariivirga sp.]